MTGWVIRQAMPDSVYFSFLYIYLSKFFYVVYASKIIFSSIIFFIEIFPFTRINSVMYQEVLLIFNFVASTTPFQSLLNTL